MEMKLKLIKRQTNKPPTKVTPRANVQLNSCSRGERDKKKTEEKCLKWGTRLCTADIFTPLCAGSKAVQLPLRFMWSFRLPPLVFLFYFGVKVSKWVRELLVHVAQTKPTLHQSYQRINRDLDHFCEMGYLPFPPGPGWNPWSSWGWSMCSGLIWAVSGPDQSQTSECSISRHRYF